MMVVKIVIGAAVIFLTFPAVFRLVQRKPKRVDWAVIVGAFVAFALLFGYRP